MYFVPGNNDLAGEDPCDLGRYKDLVRDTAKAMSGNGPDLVDLTALTVAESPQHGQYRLIGLNSASFKSPNDTNCYKPSKADTTSTGQVATVTDPQVIPGCPEFEANRLQGLEDRALAKDTFLVFTHIPDLQDPYQRQKPTCASACTDAHKDRCDSWNRCFDWSRLRDNLGKPSVGAIFAGHFHDSDRQIYASRADTTSLPVLADPKRATAEKTWVTPPLSIKNQLDKSTTARGFLLVRIQGWAGQPPHLLRLRCALLVCRITEQSTTPHVVDSLAVVGARSSCDHDWNFDLAHTRSCTRLQHMACVWQGPPSTHVPYGTRHRHSVSSHLEDHGVHHHPFGSLFLLLVGPHIRRHGRSRWRIVAFRQSRHAL